MELEINEETLSQIISSSQIFQIKQQILAYQYIIKGQPIPKEIEKNLVQISKEQWEAEKEKIFHKNLKFFKDKVEKNNGLIDLFQNKLPKIIDEKIDCFFESHYAKEYDNELIRKKIKKRKEIIEKNISLNVLEEDTEKRLKSELIFLDSKDIYFKIKEDVTCKINKEEEMPFKLYEKTFFCLNRYKREKPKKKLEVF